MGFYCISSPLKLLCASYGNGLRIHQRDLQPFWKFRSSAKNVTDKATKVIARRLKKACSSHWLHFDKSVFAGKQECESLLETFNMFQDSDAATSGFLQKLKQVKFLGTIYILAEVLPKLSALSKAFQAGKFNFSAILPAIAHTKLQLETIKAESTAFNAL